MSITTSSKLFESIIDKIKKDIKSGSIWNAIDKNISKLNDTQSEIKRFNNIILPIIDYKDILNLSNDDAIYNFNKDNIINDINDKDLDELILSIDVRIDKKKDQDIFNFINNVKNTQFQYKNNDDQTSKIVTIIYNENQNKNINLLFSLLYILFKTDKFLPKNFNSINSNKIYLKKKILAIIKNITSSDSIILKFKETFGDNIDINIDSSNLTVKAPDRNSLDRFINILNNLKFISNLYSDNYKKFFDIFSKELKHGIFDFESNDKFKESKNKFLTKLRKLDSIIIYTKKYIYEKDIIVKLIEQKVETLFNIFENNIQYKIDQYKTYSNATEFNKKLKIIEAKSITDDINKTLLEIINQTIKLISEKIELKKKLEQTYKNIKTIKISDPTLILKFEQIRENFIKMDSDIITNIAFLLKITNYIENNPILKKLINLSKIKSYINKFFSKLDSKSKNIIKSMKKEITGNIISIKNLSSNLSSNLTSISTISLSNLFKTNSSTSSISNSISNSSNYRLSNSYNILHDNKLIMIPFKQSSGIGYNYGLLNLSKLYHLAKFNPNFFSSSNDILININMNNLRNKIFDKAVIIINNNIEDANIALKWKALKIDDLIKEFKSDNKKLIRSIIIKIIENQAFYNLHTDNWDSSESRRILQTFCNKLTTKYSNCELLIGRDQISI